MNTSLLILGRQPALGLAELESLFGADLVKPLVGAATLGVNPEEVPFSRLGGSLKLAKVLTKLPHTNFNMAVDYINKTLPRHLDLIPEGKIKLGLSVYGLKTSVNDINRSALRLKKTIKLAGRSVRVVPNNELALGSAQVIHNQLTSPVGMELVLVVDGSKTILAQTVAEQDIAAYAARDQGRPMRDARVGMLPPKLAQVIVNLANPAPNTAVLDPFCGTGVVLQEAALMGFPVRGSDLEERMVRYSRDNINWLREKTTEEYDWHLETGDATKITIPKDTAVIACETYLGRPFSSQPDPDLLQEVVQGVNLIHKRFLQNIARQTQPGFHMCIAVPAWHIGREVKHLKVLDNLEDLGYNRMEFVHAGDEKLIYHREGQVVGRELVVLVRK